MTLRTFQEPLLDEEMVGFSPNAEILRYLEASRDRLGLEKAEMRVLDWGCGRGRSVAWLRDAGYEAYGVDISLEALENGKPYFERRGMNAEELISPIGVDGKTRFPDNSFDFIFSEQVLEHVENLHLVAAEMKRVGGHRASGLHLFPAQRQLVEGHLFMPLIHWLPKNKLRWALIYLFVLLGKGPEYEHVQGKNKWQRSWIYYQGNISTSFYRRYRDVGKTFEQESFVVRFVTIDTPKLKRIPLFNQVTAIKPLRSFVNWILLTFITVKLFVSEPGFGDPDR